MRRVWLAIAATALLGCNNLRDMFSAHTDTAAEAAGQNLTAQRLAVIVGGTKGIRVTREAAEFVANIWVDYTLLTQAMVQGTNLADSGAVAATMWPQIAMVKADRWFDTVLSRRQKLSPAAADSLYNTGDIRIVQHILYTVAGTASNAERQTVVRKAQGTLAKIRNGSDFGALAKAESQDVNSGRDNGYLPPNLWKRGSTVTAFDSAAWSLPPGGVSGLVETPYGYHILRRPPADEVRDRITEYLMTTVSMELDSLYRDSLATAKHLALTGSAVPLMRSAIQDPEANRHSSKAIVTYTGGKVTVGDYLRWVYAFPPQYVSQLQQAEDEQLKMFVTGIAQNTILLQQADSAGITLTPVEWAGLVQAQRVEVDSLRQMVGLGYDVNDSAVSVGERSRLAALRLDTYFDELLAGKARLRRIPPTLSAWLRRNGNFRVNEAGLLRAVELAEAQRLADSTAAVDSANRRLNAPRDSTRQPDSAGGNRR